MHTGSRGGHYQHRADLPCCHWFNAVPKQALLHVGCSVCCAKRVSEDAMVSWKWVSLVLMLVQLGSIIWTYIVYNSMYSNSNRNQIGMASNLIAMASNPIRMASNLIGMASRLLMLSTCDFFESFKAECYYANRLSLCLQPQNMQMQSCNYTRWTWV